LNRPAAIRTSIIVIPLLTILAAIPAFMGISNLWIVLMVFIQWAILWFSRKRIAQYYEFFGRKSELLGKYMQLLEFIEEREFQAPFLLDLQKKVRKPDKASHIFRQLKKLVGQFEYRQNLVIAWFSIPCFYGIYVAFINFGTGTGKTGKNWLPGSM
jgi:hypothetical protein